jgi:hypothetical protein
MRYKLQVSAVSGVEGCRTRHASEQRGTTVRTTPGVAPLGAVVGCAAAESGWPPACRLTQAVRHEVE